MGDTIHVRMTRAQLRAKLAELPAILAGRAADPTGLAQAVPLAVGTEALSIVREAFVVKARGGTDEAGESWAPLSKAYVAYGRRHPGLSRARKQAAAKGRASRPLLSAAQDKRWRELYGRKLWELARRKGVGLLAIPSAELKSQAAAFAWMILKAEGAQTILGVYGDAQVEIGRNTGQMFASLSPGVEGNVMRTEPGAAVVGTNVAHAAHFHKKRRLWPAEGRWPAAWLGRLANVALAAAENVAAALAGR